MSYEGVEAALQTLLQGVSGFTAVQVVLGDFKVLSQGLAPAMVLQYGGFEQEDVAFDGDKFVTWTVVVNLAIRYLRDDQIHNDARDIRQLVIDRINTYPRLNAAANVRRADIVRGGPMGNVEGSGSGSFYNRYAIGNNAYYIERFEVRIVEETDFTYAE